MVVRGYFNVGSPMRQLPQYTNGIYSDVTLSLRWSHWMSHEFFDVTSASLLTHLIIKLVVKCIYSTIKSKCHIESHEFTDDVKVAKVYLGVA